MDASGVATVSFYQRIQYRVFCRNGIMRVHNGTVWSLEIYPNASVLNNHFFLKLLWLKQTYWNHNIIRVSAMTGEVQIIIQSYPCSQWSRFLQTMTFTAGRKDPLNTFTVQLRIKKPFYVKMNMCESQIYTLRSRKRHLHQNLDIVQQCFCSAPSLRNQMSSIGPSIHITAQIRLIQIAMFLGNNIWLWGISTWSCSDKKWTRPRICFSVRKECKLCLLFHHSSNVCKWSL